MRTFFIGLLLAMFLAGCGGIPASEVSAEHEEPEEDY